MIEDGPGSQQHGGGGAQLVVGASPAVVSSVGSATSSAAGLGTGMVTKQQPDESGQRPQYSMPGILHFLQTEWARFEMERSQWEVERAELQARIAFLQGERKGQENLKQDLVRRIKMLEFALKAERAKYHKLKYGTDLNQDELKPPNFDKKNEDDQSIDGESITANNAAWRQGRQLLRQYLHEIGYTDTIIDVRSAKVRSLLGLQPHNTDSDAECTQPALINGEQPSKPRPADDETDAKRPPGKAKSPASLVETSLLESEASVLATFDFLATDNVVDIEDDNLSDENEDGIAADDESEERAEKQRNFKQTIGNESMAGMEDVLADPETEEALAEFDFLVSESGEGAGEARSQGDGTEWEKKDLSPTEEWGVDQQLISKLKEQYKKERKGKKGVQSPKRTPLKAMFATYNICEGILDKLNTGSGNGVTTTTTTNTTTTNDNNVIVSNNNNNNNDEDSGGNNYTLHKQLNEHAYQTLLDSVGTDSSTSSLRAPPSGNLNEDGIQGGGSISFPAPSKRPIGGVPGADDEALEAALGLGELAGLTVANEADPLSYDISAPKEVFRKTWNAKYTLRSHFDGVRSLAFHPVEPILITASEDHTLKLWNLQKTVPAKKTASVDVEPVYTFRAHEGPVLCLAVSPTGEQCYSGGVDSTIRCWKIPISSNDPYDSFDSNVLQETLIGHTDAVWGLSIHSSKSQLLSCSADGSVRLWSPGSKDSLLSVFNMDAEDGVPTSVDFVCCDPSQMVASYTSSHTYIFDIETGKQVLKLDTKQNSDPSLNNQINRVINHPTLPITITAHEDRHIRFFDNHTGKMVHSMVAHLDAVTSLAVDPNGLYLLSGSHDCSIRLWNLDSKTCVQEITSHRKKFDESIHDVAFHASKPYIASAGADAVAKVFV